MQRDAIRWAMKKLFYGLGMLILIGLSAFILMIWGMFVCMGAADWLGLSVLLLPAAYLMVKSIIKAREDKGRMLWTIGCAAAFAVSYFVWKVPFAGEYLSDWAIPAFMAEAFIISVFGAFFAKRIAAISSFAGFNMGMIAGMLWGVDSLDPGGGRTTNAWFIFLLVFFGTAAAGVLAEIIAGEVKKRGEGGRG